ncbi:MAG: MFS transporter [Alphaproteobacteria bacterium]|nr:MFS transporter [Alphaproteobacteria bacterium]
MSSGPGLAARSHALRLLIAILDRNLALDEALARTPPDPEDERRDRAFGHTLLLTCLRRLGQIDDVLDRCLVKPLPTRAHLVRHVLRLGAAQLLFLGTAAHAAVDTSVRLIAGSRLDAYRGLINAVLRRLASDGHGWVAAQDAAILNTPRWLWRSWVGAYGEEATRAIAAQHLVEPPLDLACKGDAEGWVARLEAALLPSGTLRVAQRVAVESLPGFETGDWWVQDAAAALPVRLLGDVRGRDVLDLCAAPGGKTLALAAAGARVLAVDRSAPRLATLRANLARCGLAAEIVAADATSWRPEVPAALILLDAPCSGTGTIRRHPDLQRLKKPADVTRLAALQAELLRAALSYLAPAGTLVYSVCSLEPEEGSAIVEAALAADPGLGRVAVSAAEIGGLAEAITAEGDLRTLPHHLASRGGMDGFYAARLRRLGQAGT